VTLAQIQDLKLVLRITDPSGANSGECDSPGFSVISSASSSATTTLTNITASQITSAIPTSTISATPVSTSNATKIGAGVGVPLGILLLAAFALLFIRERKHRAKTEQLMRGRETTIEHAELPLNEQVQKPVFISELPGRN